MDGSFDLPGKSFWKPSAIWRFLTAVVTGDFFREAMLAMVVTGGFSGEAMFAIMVAGDFPGEDMLGIEVCTWIW